MKKHRKTLLFLPIVMVSLCILCTGCKKKQQYAQAAPDIADSFPIAAEPAAENPQAAQSDGPYAILHTSAGDITILLYPEQAPKAVENFITLAREGYYDGTLFHYAKKGDLTQAGLPGNSEEEERSIWGEPFENEFNDDLHNYPGAVGMANAYGNLSQFYLMVKTTKPEDERIVPANLYMNELVNLRSIELQELTQQESLSEENVQQFEDDLNEEIQAIASEGIPPEYEKKYEPVIETYNRLGGGWSLDYKNTVFGQIVEGLNVAQAITEVKIEAATRKPRKDVVIESIEILE